VPVTTATGPAARAALAEPTVTPPARWVLAPALAGVLLIVVGELGNSVDTRGESWSVGYGALRRLRCGEPAGLGAGHPDQLRPLSRVGAD
jgi:hypothetical protein